MTNKKVKGAGPSSARALRAWISLLAMREFYLSFSKVHARCGELNWGNYRLLITAVNEEARRDYAEECRKSMKRQR